MKGSVMKQAFQLLLMAVCTSSAATANVVINFDNMTPTYEDMAVYVYHEHDVYVKFTPVRISEMDPDAVPSIRGVLGPNGTIGLYGGLNSPQAEIRADIAGGANYVSVDLGDYAGDSDMLFLEAFDSNDVSLGYTQQLIKSEFFGMKTLEVTANGTIAYAVFGARFPAEGGSSVIADNFTYGVIPAPGALLLGITGLACVQGLRRKRLL